MEHLYKMVNSIGFSVMSPQKIKKVSHIKVVTPELYDKEGYPVDGGLMDVRLGVIDPGLRCKTCAGKLKECVGHFGYIELARPVMHIKYMKVLHVMLRASCKECHRILLSDEDLVKYKKKIKILLKTGTGSPQKVYKLIRKAAETAKKCPHCRAKQLPIKIEKPTTILEDGKRLSPIEVRSRVEKISDDDVQLLGVNPESARPEWMVLTLLSIPPVTMRPSITLESGERSEDDLTHKLGDIVRINQRLFENINAGAPEIIVEDLWDLLQYHVTTYFDNTISQVPPARHRSGEPLKTITERIKSKEGRFRHNLAGKRVNYSGRTVISPDPMIEFNEVGIPIEIAKEITVPERVTEWNKKWLLEFVKNGPKKYPGANYIITPKGMKKKISLETHEQILEELDEGYKVERHLIDGDISIFNRQPSLHRMSIMCHKIRVLPGKSFRLNPAVCNPYNADFDGDEMNLHIPQTEEARAEAEILMEVETQIISPKQGLPVIGAIEDSVTGNYLLTQDETNLTKEEAIMMLINVGVTDSKKFKNFKKTVSGKEIFSAILPEDFNFVGTSKKVQDSDKDRTVLIKNGQLVKGIIDNNTIGEGEGQILREIHRMYEERTAVDLYGKICKLGIAYLQRRGFTTQTSDADLPGNLPKKVKDVINKAEEEANEFIQQYEKGKLKPFPSKTIEETLEIQILKRLNDARNKIGEMISKESSNTNSSIIMSNAGSKGKIMNLAQTGALVGQQALRGKRVSHGYKNRTLSLFKENDLSPFARGFVRHSYKKGLNPVEFFFHAMTGRDSLMDTALRTPKSGYLYRRLANAMQDLKIEYDFTVRDAHDRIIQFQYGDDNIDISKSENGTIDVKKLIKEVKEE